MPSKSKPRKDKKKSKSPKNQKTTKQQKKKERSKSPNKKNPHHDPSPTTLEERSDQTRKSLNGQQGEVNEIDRHLKNSKSSTDSSSWRKRSHDIDHDPPLPLVPGDLGLVGGGEVSKTNNSVPPSPNRRLSFQNPGPLPVEPPPADSPLRSKKSDENQQQPPPPPQQQERKGSWSLEKPKRPSLVPYVPSPAAAPADYGETQMAAGERRHHQGAQRLFQPQAGFNNEQEPRRLSLLREPPAPPSSTLPSDGPAGEGRTRYGSIVGEPPYNGPAVPVPGYPPNRGSHEYEAANGGQRRKSSLEKKLRRMTPPVPTIGAVIEQSRRRSSLEGSSHKNSIEESSQSRRNSNGSGTKRDDAEGVYEATVYNNKLATFDPVFKEHKAHLITPHTLYKEALYTSVHYLGVPTIRFPSNKEDLCLYAHVAFKADPKEQVQAMEHVVGEPFPLTVVNTRVRRADGIEGREHQKLPDAYCIVAVESVEAGVEFQLSIKEWQTISTGSPLRPKQVKPPQDQTRPPPEKRMDQVYDLVPPFIKTAVQLQTRTPTWDQRFQCLALRPSVDTLTIELWDNETVPMMSEGGGGGPKALQKGRKSSINGGSSHKSKNINSRKHDTFVGKVSLPVRDVPCEGESKWHYIKGMTHRKKDATGRLLVDIWLTHAYRHGRNYEEYAEPRQMLEMFWDHILQYESSRFSGEWNGEIPPAATCLIFQYALQTGISEASQAIVRWNAYAKYNLGLFSLERRLFELEHALEKARDWKDIRECELESNMVMVAIEKILPVIRNHLHESQDTVHEAVKSIKHCRDILTKFKCQSGLFKVQFWIEAEIRMAILEWYQEKFYQFSANLSPNSDTCADRVECLARLVNDVNGLMRECALKWKPLFWMDGLIDYVPLAYDEFQKMIIHDVESLCFYSLEKYDSNTKLRAALLDMEQSGARNLCKALFDLYVETQVFVIEQDKIFEPNSTITSYSNTVTLVPQVKYQHLNLYHRWFRPVLVLWLGYALVKASDMISRSIKIDNVVAQDEFVRMSSSATDAGVVYHQLATFWQQLNWPDVAEGYVILHYLFEVMCFVTIMYAKLKRAKLEKEGYFDTEDRFDISERLCTAINNIEYVKESLIKIPDVIQMDNILVDLDKAVGDSYAKTHRLRINNLLTGTLAHIELQFKKIMVGVGERVRPELREGFHECFLFLQDTSKTEDYSLVPVLSYLEDNIVILHKSLLELNFIRVLQMFWNVTCQEILYGLKRFTKTEDVRNHSEFFQRVKNIVPLLRSYYEGGGGGLNEQEIDTKHYRALILFLSCLSLPTDVLIAAYYREAAEEQMENTEQSKLGTLTVRINYHSGALVVEVISAKNLSARDEPLSFLQCCFKQEASSDPQVEVSLEPPLYFKNVKKQKTEIQWKTQNPIFNHKFTWHIAEDTCSKPESVVVLTVRDYDRVTRDDFLGQAIVPIAKMPGLMKMRPIGQPMKLELQSVEMKQNPVLTILQNRRWDKEAKQFADEQAKRVVMIKDNNSIDHPQTKQPLTLR